MNFAHFREQAYAENTAALMTMEHDKNVLPRVKRTLV